MSTRRLLIALLFAAATNLVAQDATACCLTDWLFGRRATPYVVGYAPNGQPYVAGYAPYTAGFAPTAVATTPYVAGYGSGLTASPAITPVLTSGAYQAQRPAYFQNPSVYTGLPVGTNAQASYSVPITTPLNGTTPTSSYYGSSNQYPTNYSSAYAAAYPNTASPGLPITTTTPYGAPATTLPATQVAPLFPNAPRPSIRGGLSRFFGSLFGTNYTSSYYRAPVTYYRPVTSVDPISGSTVTVQSPCTSYTQQLQRTPYSSLQVGQSQPTFVQPSTGCGTSSTPGAYAPYGATPYDPSSPYAQTPQSGVSQAGAIGTTPGQFTVPIPSTSTVAPESYYNQPGYSPNTSPLSGSPTSPRSQPGASDAGPVDQPRLEANRQSESSYREEYRRSDEDRDQPQPSTDRSEDAPKSYWQLQNADDSTALIRPETRRSRDRQPQSDPMAVQNIPTFTGVEPIRGPEEASPWDRREATPVNRPYLQAPPLPPSRAYDTSDATRASTRSSLPVREAALVREPLPQTQPYRARVARPVTEPERDSRWYTIQP